MRRPLSQRFISLTLIALLLSPQNVHSRFGRSSSPITFLKASSLHSKPSTTLSALNSLRGGGTNSKDDVHAYRLQQQLYLQSRSLLLRQALIDRGLTELQHSETDQGAQRVDWDCAVATKSSPKSCLYSFDAELDTKVIAPIDTEQWITLTALNRLRRNDPTKVEPLWHSQYQILASWFNARSQFSIYRHLTPMATLLSTMLDTPYLLGLNLMAVTVIVMLITMPLWEQVIQLVALNKIVWMNWYQWGRFVHAALPLKLLLGQLAWKGLATVFGHFYQRVRGTLVEWECQMLEQCVPLTILEGKEASEKERQEDIWADVDTVDLDDEDDDEDFDDVDVDEHDDNDEEEEEE